MSDERRWTAAEMRRLAKDMREFAHELEGDKASAFRLLASDLEGRAGRLESELELRIAEGSRATRLKA
jgi:hypothetical protein